MRLSTFSSFDLAALADQLSVWGVSRVHAGPLLREFYARGGQLLQDNPDWPKGLLERLRPLIQASAAGISARQQADDGTIKLLLRLTDGRSVESVMMPALRPDRAAGCLSSQVGCAMGCDFCATAQTGFARNLEAGEIVDQFLALRREALGTGRKLQTVVFMGMGEPLLNLQNVLAAVRRIADNEMGALGWRQVTVSTVGIVPAMAEFTAAGLNINLAVSLHAPDDETRARLIPPAKRYRIAEILEAADRHQESTGHPVSIQYCLLRGINDSVEHARLLAGWLAKRRMHLNLLTYNPTGVSLLGNVYQATELATADAFIQTLRAAGVVTHFRRPRGVDIDAACGQLRRRVTDQNPLAANTPTAPAAARQ